MAPVASWRPRVLLIGATGFLGSLLLRALARRYRVLGTFCSRRRAGLVHLDLFDQQEVETVVRRWEPEVVIHCGGMTRPDACELDEALATRVNVEGTKHVLRSTEATVVYFSTDYVFDGETGGYTENARPNPVNHYGLTKLRAELAVLDHSSRNVVIRVAGLYGHDPENDEFLDSLRCTRDYATDCVSSNTLIYDVAEYLPLLLQKGGLYHLCGPGPLSRYSFARLAVETLGIDVTVSGALAANVYLIARRPADSSLKSKRHSLPMAGPEEGLLRVRQALDSGRRP